MSPASHDDAPVPSIIAQSEVFITRLLNAPRVTVFRAWSSADTLRRWYAPDGCEIPHIQVDFRVGGTLHQCIRTPGGDCWCKGEYLEIVDAERIVFSMRFSDAAGNEVDTSPVGKDPEWPMETVVTVTFEVVGNKTKLTLHQTASEDVARRTGAYGSWLQMLDRLDEQVAPRDAI